MPAGASVPLNLPINPFYKRHKATDAKIQSGLGAKSGSAACLKPSNLGPQNICRVGQSDYADMLGTRLSWR